MKRNVSFSSLSDAPPERATMRRMNSEIWDWKSSTPPASRDPSAHAGNLFKPASTNVEALGEGLRRNLSFMWDWGKYRTSPAPSRNASLHGGDAFALAADGDGEKAAKGGSLTPAFEPPRSMRKDLSIGSFMWNWAQARVSPPGTPAGSLHGGNRFEPGPVPVC